MIFTGFKIGDCLKVKPEDEDSSPKSEFGRIEFVYPEEMGFVRYWTIDGKLKYARQNSLIPITEEDFLRELLLM